MELFFGAKNKNELKKIKKGLSTFEIIHLNDEISNITLKLMENYSKSHGLKIPDALIASTAILTNFPLWTYNRKDFIFIEKLKLYK